MNLIAVGSLNVFVIGTDVQIIDSFSKITTSVIQDFKNKVYWNEKGVVKVIFAEKIGYTISCSLDGKIVVWKSIYNLLPAYSYQMKRQNEQCLDMLLFQDDKIVSLFTTGVLVFNIRNYFNSTFYPTQSTSYRGIQVSPDFIYIFSNQSMTLLQDINTPYQTVDYSNTSINSIQKVFVSKLNFVLILDTLNYLNLYKIIKNDDGLPFMSSTPVGTRIMPSSVPLIQLFDLKIGVMQIVYYDGNSSVIVILDNLLNILKQQSVPMGRVFRINLFEDMFYFCTLKYNNVQLTNRYTSMLIDMNSDDFKLVGDWYILDQMVQIKRKFNYYGEETIRYIGMSPIGYTSFVVEGSWNQQKEQTPVTPFDRFIFCPGQNAISAFSDSKNDIIYLGSYEGQVRVTSMKKEVVELVKKRELNEDTFSQIFYDFIIGRYCLVGINIRCFSIYTDQLMESITFTIKPVQIYLSPSFKVLIGSNSKQLIILSFSDKQQKVMSTSCGDKMQCPLDIINGFYLDESSKNGQLYIFGNGLIKVDLSLNNQIDILEQNNHKQMNKSNFQKCLFTQVIVCKIDFTQIAIFEMNSNYQLINYFTLPSELYNFNMIIDSTYKKIFLYTNYIEVYTYDGIFFTSITPSVYPIIQFNFYGKHILILNSPVAFVYLRSTLEVKASFNGSGGYFLGGTYLSDYSLFAYYLEEVRFGQVLFYSFETYSTQGSATNVYSSNGVGKVVKISYDQENQMVYFIDQYGNAQTLIISNQRASDNIFRIEEIKEQLTGVPTDYIQDFNTNTLYIINNDRLWRLNQNMFTRPFMRLQGTHRNTYIILNSESTSLQQQDIRVVLADYNNILFEYQSFQVKYFSQFSDEIIDMRMIPSSQANNIYIFIFNQYIQVYLVQNSFIFQQDNFNYKIEQIRLNEFLIIDKDIAIFSTFDHSIIDYNFTLQKLRTTIQLPASCEAISHLQIGSIASKDLILFVATTCQSLIRYDAINLTVIQNTSLTPGMITVASLLSNELGIAVIDKNGGAFSYNKESLSLQQDQPLMNAVNWLKKQQVPTPSSIASQIRQTTPEIPFVSVLDIDLQRDRLLLNLDSEKKIGIFKLSTMEFLQYLMFPDDQWKIIYKNHLYLLLTSASQVNIHLVTDLSFVGSVRRYNRKDKLTDVILVDGNKLILVFSVRIETILISTTTGSITMIDSLTAQDSRIIYFKVWQDQTLRYIGIGNNGIFERRLSLNLFDTLVSNPTQIQYCQNSLKYTNQASTQNKFDQILNSSKYIQYIFSVSIDGYLKKMQFINNLTTNSLISSQMIILRPADLSDNVLQIEANSFQQLPFNIYLDSFDLVLQSVNEKIQIYQSAMNATFQNLIIQNQEISKNAGFYFESKNIIIFHNLTFKNITFSDGSNNNRMLSENDNGAFFKFTNCSQIIISDVIIQDSQFAQDISFFSVNQFISLNIYSLTIINTNLQNLLQVFKGTNLVISSIKIINCTSTNYFSDFSGMNMIPSYIIIITGVLNINITQLQASDNLGILLLFTNKQYEFNNSIVQLINDIISITDSSILNNGVSKEFTNDSQQSLIQIQSSSVNIDTMIFLNNQANIFIYNSAQIDVLNSIFKNNQGIEGAAMNNQEISNGLNLSNCTFEGNTAQASGGALYLLNIGSLNIDQSTKIINNSATIGGGIRIISTYFPDLWKSYNIHCFSSTKTSYNQAEIYGNDIGIYPVSFEIYFPKLGVNGELSSEFELVYAKQFDEVIKPLEFNNLQSGSAVSIRIKLLDQYNMPLTINTKKYQQSQYSALIQKELSGYFIEAVGDYSTSTSPLEIKGESLLNIKQYNEQSNSFGFSSLTISSQPNLIVSNLSFKITINSFFKSFLIPTTIKFRTCQIGEIQVFSTSTASSALVNSPLIIQCLKCANGTYSLSLSSDNQCLKCPSSSSSCSGNQIVLNQGYWRSSNKTDEIISCKQQSTDICWESNDESRRGCMKGYMGPLCEVCDLTGEVWEGKRFTESLSQNQCNECSDSSYQALFSVLGALVIFSYIFFSIFYFMDRYMYNSQCCYIRFLNMLPLSKSSVIDQSSFFIKALLNYLQLSSILFQYQLQFIPQMIASIPQLSGQPVTKLVISLQCLYRIQDIKHFGEEKLRSILQTCFPLALFFILLIILIVFQRYKIWQVRSFHKYMMINVLFLLFQSDSVTFFSSALSCRDIGSKSYRTINLLIECSEKNYMQFALVFILPNLLFWILAPALLLYQLVKSKNKNKNSLQYCTMKYKFGYFYLEFEEKYYYWEFIRIYVKIFLVLMITLLQSLGITLYLLCTIIIFLYIILVMIFKPFYSLLLQRLEIMSYLVIVPSIFFSQLNLQNSQQIYNIIISVFHFGYICYMLFIIIKFKIFSHHKSPLIQWILKQLLSLASYEKISSAHKVTLKTLLRWKFIYRNLHQIRSNKVQEQLGHLSFNNSIKKSQQKISNSQMHTLQGKSSQLSPSNLCMLDSVVVKGTSAHLIKDFIKEDNSQEVSSHKIANLSFKSMNYSSLSPIALQHEQKLQNEETISEVPSNISEHNQEKLFNFPVDLIQSSIQSHLKNSHPKNTENSGAAILPQFSQLGQFINEKESNLWGRRIILSPKSPQSQSSSLNLKENNDKF